MRRLFVLLLSGLLGITSVYADAAHFANRPDVKTFIHHMVKQYKFREAVLITWFNTVKIRPAVVKKVKAPLEKEPWSLYQRLFVTEWRIRNGVEFWNRYQSALTQAETKYGVPANIIVATIGVETKYGMHTGQFKVIDALSNLAFSHTSRAPFFRHELEEFLLLSREQKWDPLKVRGSYAGAIGQPQFMPSSYRRFAVSFNDHAKADLTNNELDIIASIANYYKLHGWQPKQPIAIPASVANQKHSFFFSSDPIDELIKNKSYKMISLHNYWGNEYWYGFHNFDVIKRYNPSDAYAMAVLQLGQYISSLKEKLNNA
jgi:membrane-bound lytic murein transglycosylase B